MDTSATSSLDTSGTLDQVSVPPHLQHDGSCSILNETPVGAVPYPASTLAQQAPFWALRK